MEIGKYNVRTGDQRKRSRAGRRVTEDRRLTLSSKRNMLSFHENLLCLFVPVFGNQDQRSIGIEPRRPSPRLKGWDACAPWSPCVGESWWGKWPCPRVSIVGRWRRGDREAWWAMFLDAKKVIIMSGESMINCMDWMFRWSYKILVNGKALVSPDMCNKTELWKVLVIWMVHSRNWENIRIFMPFQRRSRSKKRIIISLLREKSIVEKPPSPRQARCFTDYWSRDQVYWMRQAVLSLIIIL